MLIREIMNTNLVTVTCNTFIRDAVSLFHQHKIDAIPVVEEGRLIGLFTKSQFLNVFHQDGNLDIPVAMVMERNVFTLPPDTSLYQMKHHMVTTGVSRFPVVDEENRLLGIITRTDILLGASSEAFTLNNELQAVLDSAHNGVIAIDKTGRIKVVNQAAAEIFCIDPKKWIGQPLLEVIPSSGLMDVLKSGKPQIGCRMEVGDTILVTNRTPIRVEGEIVGAIAVFEDVTGLERIAEELASVKALKETLSLIVENPYEGTIIIDGSGKIKMINQTFCHYLDIRKEDAVDRFVNDVIPESQLMEVIRSGQPQFAEMWRVKGHDMVVMRVPIVQNGKIIGAIEKTLFTEFQLARAFAQKLKALEKELAYVKKELKKERKANYTFDHFIGNSDKIQKLVRKAKKAAHTTSTVLITGESGTGKEVLAHAIHHASPRSNEPLVRVNCASIPDTLLESELFGYEEGAFTGARRGGKPGKFEAAQGGTIFLDEIGDMPLSMQSKLLRVLQEREFERIGGNKPIKVDVRVIAATNRDLEQLVEDGGFREDLYYRLNVVALHIPPLREHREDILVLGDYLIKKLNGQLDTTVSGLTMEAKNLLLAYHWPGNIRELQNVLEQAINLSDGMFLSPEDFPLLMKKLGKNRAPAVAEVKPLNQAMLEAERELILAALKYTGNNKMQAAKILNIHRSMLYRKMSSYNLL